MNGCVIANTPIAVDFWKIRECPQARLFFLTHLHGDHIAGLTSSWHYPIFCSEITGRLLKHKCGLKDGLIKVMELDSPIIVYLDREDKEQMTVTALDANHCPGAVMFLFEGYFGRILHTGDFRFTPEMIQHPPLSQLSGQIDTLYLDNTYCSPKCIFPTRDSATESIIRIIRARPHHDIVIGMRNLGKENLLSAIAIEIDTWISVPSSYLKTLQILEVVDVFKSNSPECRVRVVPFHRISNKFVGQLNEERPTIVILPTALYEGIDAVPYVNQDDVFVVPYSDHSSYAELETFVSFLKPCTIIPVVKSKSRGPFGVNIADRSDMACFQEYLNTEMKEGIKVPESVKSFMNNNRDCRLPIGKPCKKKSASKTAKCLIKKQKSLGVTYEAPSEALECDIQDSTDDKPTCQWETLDKIKSSFIPAGHAKEKTEDKCCTEDKTGDPSTQGIHADGKSKEISKRNCNFTKPVLCDRDEGHKDVITVKQKRKRIRSPAASDLDVHASISSENPAASDPINVVESDLSETLSKRKKDDRPPINSDPDIPASQGFEYCDHINVVESDLSEYQSKGKKVDSPPINSDPDIPASQGFEYCDIDNTSLHHIAEENDSMICVEYVTDSDDGASVDINNLCIAPFQSGIISENTKSTIKQTVDVYEHPSETRSKGLTTSKSDRALCKAIGKDNRSDFDVHIVDKLSQQSHDKWSVCVSVGSDEVDKETDSLPSGKLNITHTVNTENAYSDTSNTYSFEYTSRFYNKESTEEIETNEEGLNNGVEDSGLIKTKETRDDIRKGETECLNKFDPSFIACDVDMKNTKLVSVSKGHKKHKRHALFKNLANVIQTFSEDL